MGYVKKVKKILGKSGELVMNVLHSSPGPNASLANKDDGSDGWGEFLDGGAKKKTPSHFDSPWSGKKRK